MKIRQIALISSDLGRSRDEIADLLSLDPPYRDPVVAYFGLDNAVFAFGEHFIEVVSPIEEGTAGGRHLARCGEGGYMLLLQTDNLKADRERVDRLGIRRVRNTDHPDMSASHLHPKDVGGAIVSFDEPRPPESWRWGGPDWQVQPGPRSRQRIRGLTLQANDPQEMATRWASIFDLQSPDNLGNGRWRVLFDQGFADFEPAEGRHEGIVGFALSVVEPDALFQRAQKLGLRTEADEVILCGARLKIEGI